MERYLYERDDPDPYPDAVSICGESVAWWVLGWEVEPDEDTEWTGIYNRTGRLVCQMVGDDAYHLYDPEDIEYIERENYCGVCGQIGCVHDGLDRDDYYLGDEGDYDE